MQALLERVFKLEQHGTRASTEVLAGVTTFITMAYIIFVNPQMMASAGMDQGASFAATCLAAALACIFMGVYANWPVGLAPGMGLNAFFTYTVVGEMGYSWQVALGAVFIAGVLFVIMSVTRLRAWMLNSIPMDLRVAMGAGVGLFVGFIGLKSGGVIVASDATFLTLGDLTRPEPFLACIGFLLIAVLSIRQVHGAIIIGILTVTLLALFQGQFGPLVRGPLGFPLRSILAGKLSSRIPMAVAGLVGQDDLLQGGDGRLGNLGRGGRDEKLADALDIAIPADFTGLGLVVRSIGIGLDLLEKGLPHPVALRSQGLGVHVESGFQGEILGPDEERGVVAGGAVLLLDPPGAFLLEVGKRRSDRLTNRIGFALGRQGNCQAAGQQER